MSQEPSGKARYLIVGNSVGCIGAIEAIRQRDADGAIRVVSDEPIPAYSRPQIAGFLAGELDIEQALYRPRSFYPDYGVELTLNRTVTQIDPVAHTATLDDGQVIQWEQLLLATGGTPIVPPVQGLTPDGYHTFTTMADAQTLRAHLPTMSQALVVGGGLIGLSVTEALSKVGVSVTVVELAPHILGRALDTIVSEQVQSLMESKGVRILTGCSVQSVAPSPTTLSPKRMLATLSSGLTVSYDVLIMAIGVRPRVDLAADAGIDTARGILVNRHMRTSADDIYACGDAVEAFDFVAGEPRLTPIWPSAYLGGRVAGLNMAGDPARYEGSTGMNALHSFGYPILSAGTVNAPDDDDAYVELIQDNLAPHGAYKKIVLRDGVIVGFLFAGDIDRAGVVYGLMRKGVDATAYVPKLLDQDAGLISLPATFRFDLLRDQGVARRVMEN